MIMSPWHNDEDVVLGLRGTATTRTHLTQTSSQVRSVPNALGQVNYTMSESLPKY